MQLVPCMCALLSVSLPAAYLLLCPPICNWFLVCVHSSLSLCLLHIYCCVLLSAWLLVCVHASRSLCLLYIYCCVLLSAWFLVCVYSSLSLFLLHIYHCVLITAWLFVCVHSSLSLFLLHIIGCSLKMPPLDDASLGRCVPWLTCRFDVVSLINVSWPWTASRDRQVKTSHDGLDGLWPSKLTQTDSTQYIIVVKAWLRFYIPSYPFPA
jgi:hypothetical protein